VAKCDGGPICSLDIPGMDRYNLSSGSCRSGTAIVLVRVTWRIERKRIPRTTPHRSCQRIRNPWLRLMNVSRQPCLRASYSCFILTIAFIALSNSSCFGENAAPQYSLKFLFWTNPTSKKKLDGGRAILPAGTYELDTSTGPRPGESHLIWLVKSFRQPM